MASLNDIIKNKSQERRLSPSFGIQMIPYTKLIPSQDNQYSMDHIVELAQMIKLSGGIKQNLLARKTAPDTYELIAGHRRRLAAQYLVEKEGLKQYTLLPVHVCSSADLAARLDLYLTNAGQRDKTDYDRMLDIEGLTETLKEMQQGAEEEKQIFCQFCEVSTPEEVTARRLREIMAAKLKMSETKIANLKHINTNLSPGLKDKFRDQKIGISAANEAAGLPKEKQKELEKKEKISMADVEGIKFPETAMPIPIEEETQNDQRSGEEQRQQEENQTTKIEGHAAPPDPEEEGKRIHRLRISPEQYGRIVRGEQLFLLLKNDQDFRELDELELMMFEEGRNTGKMIEAYIPYLEEDRRGLKEGYCILGLQVMSYSPQE